MEYFHLTATFAIVLFTIVLFAIDRFSIETISLGVLVTLLLLFGVFPYTGTSGHVVSIEDLLSGFSSPALVTVLALLIVGKGLFATDALEGITNRIGKLYSRKPRISVAVILIVAGTTSAFLNNTPVVVIFIPVLASLAASFRLRAYQIFMPLSFITILGGMTTTIGSSTNMIAVGMAAKSGIDIGLFDISGLGVILALIGYAYVLFVLPRILRSRQSELIANPKQKGALFLGEIALNPQSRFLGLKPTSGFFPELAPFTLHSLVRDGRLMLPPYDDTLELAAGDKLQLTGTRKAFMKLAAQGEAAGIAQTGKAETAGARRVGADYHLAEAVVAPGSRFEGRTIRFCGIQAAFGVAIYGVLRKNRMGRGALDYLRLEAGDTLLVGGGHEAIGSMRGNHDILLLEHSAESVPPRDKALIASLIFGAIVLLSATGISPIVVNAVVGALLMILTGCLTLEQAARAFERQLFLLIGASIAMATALQATGGAALIARGAVSLAGDTSAVGVITILFVTVALLTNILSNNASAALFMPIALDMAERVGAPPMAFVAAVIYAANCSFVTPIAYQTNMLVMGPGHYSFGDFVRAGTPLLILMTISFALLAPWYYNL
ncbi:SLC13 family permease [Martelella sp. HB161492]|uniref:SLC13 family permease n=1 Tax=Martelella sp. HB161492 TaxID=2720726 RepID=UPI0015906ABC|nr:SLC13 family permease [Martelella sp. HB161492]